ncbi:MAG: YbjN domain-containing protein [Gemmataceae bacterium]|nr:YbjN domain-containing protein [Gemmataceae bacterium]
MRWWKHGTALTITALGLALIWGQVQAQDAGQGQVMRNVSNDKLEKILKDLNITFKKTTGKKEGTHFYDYDRNNYKIRIHNYDGKDLWIDALFNDKTTLEEVNKWNVRAKFSRAVLIRDGDKETISLESQIDCLGGITEGMIRQFVNRFDGEIRDFVKFISK